MQDEVKSSFDELFCNQFTLKIKDEGPGLSQEGVKNLFVDFQKLQENQD